MNSFKSSFILSVILSVAAGCSKNNAPTPAAMTMEEAPGKVEAAFKSAPPEVAAASKQAADAIASRNAPRAFSELQSLVERTDITPEQRRVASQALVTAGDKLRQAAEAGDPQAAQLLSIHRARK